MLGARVVVVDIVKEKLDHAMDLCADAAVNAADEDTAAAIIETSAGRCRPR
ncbi:MAG: hypothetical protein AAGH67_18475 [Cyanobacteria bacterium P01_H01_bin.162]